METFCENIAFKLNTMKITLSVDVTSEIYQALIDDEGAVEYIRQLLDSGDTDLGTELKTVQRKDNDSYTLLYDKNTNILRDLDCNATAGPSSKSTVDVKKFAKAHVETYVPSPEQIPLMYKVVVTDGLPNKASCTVFSAIKAAKDNKQKVLNLHHMYSKQSKRKRTNEKVENELYQETIAELQVIKRGVYNIADHMKSISETVKDVRNIMNKQIIYTEVFYQCLN